MSNPPVAVALALQGGGSHGAYTWGVLERLLQEVEAGRLRIAAISGSSAGALNAAVTATGLVQGGAGLARRRLSAFWQSLARAGFRGGNFMFFPEPSPFGGYDLDFSPLSIALEAANLVVSPYTNPFYTDSLAPLIARNLSPVDFAALNQAASPRVFISATDVANTSRTIFSQPDISPETLRASAALPNDFKAVTINGVPYWDGGYLGNPALTPLLDHAQDLLLVPVNPLERTDMPPKLAPLIMDRLNEITFNASLVLEINAIEAVNRLLAELAAAGTPYQGRYRPIRLHAIRDDGFLATLGFTSKSSTSIELLKTLRDAGYRSADAWLKAHGDALGLRSSMDVDGELAKRLKGRGRAPGRRA